MARVITVHGIWTEGRWQEEIAPVLYPHFEPGSVKYRSYRFLGPLDLVFEPWVLLPGLALWGAALFLSWWREWLELITGASLGVLLIIIFVLAHLLVHFRLTKTVQKFLDVSAPGILTGRVHVIAHSLGSYIVCTALQNEETMFAQRLVLTGCVVDSSFSWGNLLAQKKFMEVRNEVAGHDFVAWAAKCLHWRFHNFGPAGRNGFRDTENLVHTVQSPNQSCSIRPDAARVHNFISAKKGHSGVLKSTYAKYYWLPFFWGIDPCEFREFLDECLELMKAIVAAGSPSKPPPGGDFDRVAERFMTREWAWAGRCTIAKYLNDAGRPLGTPGDEKIIAFNVCISVTKAEDALGAKVDKWMKDPVARRNYQSVEHDDAIKALDPRTAVTRAFLAYKE